MKRLLTALLAGIAVSAHAAPGRGGCQALEARVHLDEAARAGAVGAEDTFDADHDLIFAQSAYRALCRPLHAIHTEDPDRKRKH